MKSLLNQRYPSHTLTLQVPQLTTEGFPSLSRGCVAPENLADQRKELFGSHLRITFLEHASTLEREETRGLCSHIICNTVCICVYIFIYLVFLRDLNYLRQKLDKVLAN